MAWILPALKKADQSSGILEIHRINFRPPHLYLWKTKAPLMAHSRLVCDRRFLLIRQWPAGSSREDFLFPLAPYRGVRHGKSLAGSGLMWTSVLSVVRSGVVSCPAAIRWRSEVGELREQFVLGVESRFDAMCHLDSLWRWKTLARRVLPLNISGPWDLFLPVHPECFSCWSL